MKLFSWIAAVLIGVAVLFFAVENREPVRLGLWPFEYRQEAPLFAAVLIAGALSFLGGGLIAWLSGSRTRRLARQRKRRVNDLERQLRLAQDAAEAGHETAPTTVPSGPPSAQPRLVERRGP